MRTIRMRDLRTRDRLELASQRATCRIKGHRWDSDRPAGPIHLRDICWRCDAVRDHAN